MSLANMKPEGVICFDDGLVLPFLGEANTMSMEDWNRMCEERAIEQFTAYTGHAPESAAEAFAYLERRHENENQVKSEQAPVPVRYGAFEIIAAEPRQNTPEATETARADT